MLENVGNMTTSAYYNAKKKQFYEKAGCNPGDETAIDEEWYLLSNQIRAGKMLKLSNEQVEYYADDSYSFEKREFIKSCLYENIDDEVIDKIVSSDDIHLMQKFKIEYYKSEHIMKNLEGTVNTIKSAVGDCEERFETFEKYLNAFDRQLKSKEDELAVVQADNRLLNEECKKAQSEVSRLTLLIAENEAKQNRTFVVNRIYQVGDDEGVPLEDSITEEDIRRKKVFGFTFPKIKLKKVTDTEESDLTTNNDVSVCKKVKYAAKPVSIGNVDLDTYIINAGLSTEQLMAISNAVENGIDDKFIVSFIENNLSAEQIKSNISILIARRNIKTAKPHEAITNEATNRMIKIIPNKKKDNILDDNDEYMDGEGAIAEMDDTFL